MPKSMPQGKVELVENLILALLRQAKAKADEGDGMVPVNDPDYAEAYGLHRGFLVAIYGKYDQNMPIAMPDGTGTTPSDWWRGLRERGVGR